MEALRVLHHDAEEFCPATVPQAAHAEDAVEKHIHHVVPRIIPQATP
jgi:hypothetical protein